MATEGHVTTYLQGFYTCMLCYLGDGLWVTYIQARCYIFLQPCTSCHGQMAMVRRLHNSKSILARLCTPGEMTGM